jgi:C-terminal processing protease CtpA/Prc
MIDDDWPSTLREFLPRLVAAETWDAYRLELVQFIARIHDTHANLWSELDILPPRGSCQWPVALRFVEGQATVTALTDEPGQASGLEVGDVVHAIDGHPVDSLIEAWSPYYAASNQPTRLDRMARFLPRGDCGETTLAIERHGISQTVVVARIAEADRTPRPHDRPGETFQLLSADVAYLKLSSIRVRDVVGYLEQASNTRGLVIDIRNYPSEFVVFELGSRLIQESTPFVRFTKGDLDNPGAFSWTPALWLPLQPPGYAGTVAILVDETSLSQAEYTAMALRAGPRAVASAVRRLGPTAMCHRFRYRAAFAR